MTEGLLKQLEERMLSFISQAEDSDKTVQKLREQLRDLHAENEALKNQRAHDERKLKDLIALLDSIDVSSPAVNASHVATIKPVLVQA